MALEISGIVADTLPSSVKVALGKMDIEKQAIFEEEYRRKMKNPVLFLILAIIFPIHYFLLGEIGKGLLFWITGGGFFIWWIVDIFRIYGMIERLNEESAKTQLRDIKEKINTKDNENQNTNENKLNHSKQSTSSDKKLKKKWKKTKIAVGILVALGIISALTSEEKASLKHKILNQALSDTPIKTQVEQRILLLEKPNAEKLRSFLKYQYGKVRGMTGFKHHSSPTSIYLYIYTSKERAKTGSQWIAMLDKSHAAKTFSIRINDAELSQLKTGAKIRFGLTEQKRKELYKQYSEAEKRASKEAQKKYPSNISGSLKVGQVATLTRNTSLMPAINPKDLIADMARMTVLRPSTKIRIMQVQMKNNTPWYYVSVLGSFKKGWINSIGLMGQFQKLLKRNINKSNALEQKLVKKYKMQITRENKLTVSIMNSILDEGMMKDWTR